EFETKEKFPTRERITDRCFRLARSHPMLVPTHSESSLKKWSALNNNEPIPKSTKGIELYARRFIILGQRLRNAALGYCEKHPIILPRHCLFELLIDHAHRATLHGSTQLTLRNLRQKYWIIGDRNLLKAHI
ncbi:hypothetical protein HN011_008559, partial [Eciton burchellii]